MSKELNLLEETVELTDSKGEASAPLVDILDKARQRAEKEEFDSQAQRQVKRLIEGLLFSTTDPLSLKKIREVTDAMSPLKPRVLNALIEELQREYDDRGHAFELVEMEDGYLMRTRPEYGKYIDLLYRTKRGELLSHAATEVLAIVAYKQPVTRSQIDGIRGVDSSGTLYSLLERGLVEVSGRLEAPGRPSLYVTTTAFLKYFGLTELRELPKYDTLLAQAKDLEQVKKK